MTMVTVDDVLEDAVLRARVDQDLVDSLEAALATARQRRRAARAKRDGYTLVISEHGDIEVEIDAFNGFDNWVADAQDLALHVGPATDPNTGIHAYQLLGRDADGEAVEQPPGLAERAPDNDAGMEPDAGLDIGPADGPSWGSGLPPLHWPGWSPRLGGGEGGETGADLTVEVERVTWAWRCDGCGAASADADDFEAGAADRKQRTCDCGGTAVPTPAVFCGSCDTLILLRSTDPDAAGAARSPA